jgi:hypothetical protein
MSLPLTFIRANKMPMERGELILTLVSFWGFGSVLSESQTEKVTFSYKYQ